MKSALVVGGAINVISLAQGSPYVAMALALVVGIVDGLLGRRSALSWIVLASVLASNPHNWNATLPGNAVFALVYLGGHLRQVLVLPRFIQAAAAAALLSALGGAPFFSLGGDPARLFFQISSFANYVVTPYLLVPAIYSRFAQVGDTDAKVKGLVYGLVAPTLLLLLAARIFGQPISDEQFTGLEYRFYAIYRLFACDIVLTRTQVGFVLAASICTASAVLMTHAGARLRLAAGVALAIAAGLLLSVGGVGSIVSAIAGMTVMAAATRNQWSVRRVMFAVAAVGALSLIAPRVLPDDVQGYLEGRYEQRFSGGSVDASDRTALWAMAANYLAENPTGVGWGLRLEPLGIYPHNDYLTYAIAFGVLMGVVYACLPLVVLWKLIARLRRGMSDAQVTMNAVGVGVVTAFMVNSLSDHMTANRWYFNVVWSLIWYAYFAGAPREPRTQGQA